MRRYSFSEDGLIASSCRVWRQSISFQKHPLNPVLRPEFPWESEIYTFGSLLREDRYRCWYQVLNRRTTYGRKFETAVGYAESDNGIIWHKPRIGIRLADDTVTHFVMPSSGRTDLCSPSVIRLQHGKFAGKYLMAIFDAVEEQHVANYCGSETTAVDGWIPVKGEGIFICTSDDGLRWHKPAMPVITGPNDTCALVELEGTLLLTFKTSVHDERHFRIIAGSTSEDGGLTWSTPRILLEPDYRDAPGVEFYGMTPFLNFGRLYGFLWIYHNAADDKHMDIQLVCASSSSEPLVPWQRCLDRATLLACGRPGEWDAGRVHPSNPLLECDSDGHEYWLLAYGGRNTRHDDRRYNQSAIGLASSPDWTFCEIQSDHRGGWLLTHPILLNGSFLAVSYTSAPGLISVDIGEQRNILSKITAPTSFHQSVFQIPADLRGTWQALRFHIINTAVTGFWLTD